MSHPAFQNRRKYFLNHDLQEEVAKWGTKNKLTRIHENECAGRIVSKEADRTSKTLRWFLHNNEE
jgi:hypothetical protein